MNQFKKLPSTNSLDLSKTFLYNQNWAIVHFLLHISPLYIANIKELSNVTGGLILFLWKIYVKTLNLTWYFLSICIVVLYVWFRFLWFLLTGTWIWAQDLGGYRQFYKVHIRYNKLHYLVGTKFKIHANLRTLEFE